MPERLQIGYLQTYGSDRVAVSLLNGKTVTATPQGAVNGRKVLVWQDVTGAYFCKCETDPIVLATSLSPVRILPEEEEVVEELLPFQVLTNNLILGGDRPAESLGEGSYPLVGVSNLGQQTYIATWYAESNCNITSVGQVSSVSAFPLCPTPEDPIWYGYGKIGLIYQFAPEENLTVEEEGSRLPLDLPQPCLYRVTEEGFAIPPLGFYQFPHYPIFVERRLSNSLGRKDTTQQEEGYDLSIVENWDYRLIRSGSNPTPSAADIFAICLGANAGLSELLTFTRRTSADYSRETNITLSNPIELWLGANVYKGDAIETVSESYSFNCSDALFSTASRFVCVADPYFQFSQGYFAATSSDANWSGETSEETRSYLKTVEEPVWEYPASLSGTREVYETSSYSFESSTNYKVESESWRLGSNFPPGFNFEVPGIETQTIERIETVDFVRPKLLLLGASGNESFFLETSVKNRTQFNRDRERSIPRLLYDYSTEFPTVNSNTEVTEFVIDRQEELYLFDGEEAIALDLVSSFALLIKEDSPAWRADTTENFNNDGDIIFQFPKEVLTRYIKTTTVVDNGVPEVEYSEVESYLNPVRDIFEDREVIILNSKQIATGVMTSTLRYESPNPDLEIETIVEVTRVTVRIKTVEEYQTDLVKENQIIIYSADNAAAFLKNHLLQPDNKEYCNLIGTTLYFSQAVKYLLSETTQRAEVFELVDNLIVNNGFEEGEFIAMDDAPESVKSVSYYPV